MLSGCDPDAVPDNPAAADVSVEVQAGGDGLVFVYPGVGRTDEDRQRLLDAVDPDVFSASAERELGDNGGGYPILIYTSPEVFRRGSEAHVAIDTRALCEQLQADGYTSLTFFVRAPVVPHDWELEPRVADETFGRPVATCADAPRGALVLHPTPNRFWVGLALGAAVVALNLVMFVIARMRKRRWRQAVVSVGALATVASAWLIFTGAGASGDNAEVAGDIGHPANIASSIALVIVALLGPIAALVQVALALRSTDKRQTAPWPPPPQPHPQ